VKVSDQQKATVMNLNNIQDAIVTEMTGLEDGFAKFDYLIALGKRHSVDDQDLNSEANLVPGCQSQVWIKTILHEGVLTISADSDALITKGILSLVLRVLNNQSPEDIIGADLYFIEQTGLGANLSPTRANGLLSIINSIKSAAKMLS
jgi:cysteine desulfuration protein SufE